MKRCALFLDRDGTLVHPRHYPSRPEDLVLYSNIAVGLRELQDAGFLLIVITNQAGLARGYFHADDLARMHTHLTGELAALGVFLDGIYYCPHHPDGVIADLKVMCDCRKPQPGMLLRAAADFDIDLGRSWFIGDILDDVEAGHRAGCRTVLVDLGTEYQPTTRLRYPDFIARNTHHALAIVAAVEGLRPGVSLRYLPAGWQGGLRTAMRRPGVEPA